MSLAETLTLNLCEARDGPLAGLQHDTSSFISVTNSLIFVFSQELHILHEGVHVSHSGREWHGPLLQLQNEVLWESRTKQEQRHHLHGHWGLCTAGSGAWDCVVQGKIFPFYLLSEFFFFFFFFSNEELQDVEGRVLSATWNLSCILLEMEPFNYIKKLTHRKLLYSSEE